MRRVNEISVKVNGLHRQVKRSKWNYNNFKLTKTKVLKSLLSFILFSAYRCHFTIRFVKR